MQEKDQLQALVNAAINFGTFQRNILFRGTTTYMTLIFLSIFFLFWKVKKKLSDITLLSVSVISFNFLGLRDNVVVRVSVDSAIFSHTALWYQSKVGD
jgi:uncharacterized protein YycO